MSLAIPATQATPPAVVDRGLWHYVWKLLRIRVQIYISGFKRAKRGRKIVMIIVWLMVLLFFGFVFTMSWLLLRFLNSEQFKLIAQSIGNFDQLVEAIPVLIVATSFLGILLTSFGVLLQALYLSGDMDFLLSAPVPIRAVFVAKLLQAILPNFGLSLLLSLPVLFGLGVAYHYNILYYPMVIIVLACLALAAAGLSGLLVMGVVRIFPARRVAEVLGFLGAIFSIVCSQSGNLLNTMNLEKRGFTGQEIPVSMISRFNSPWSPLAWAGRGLVDLGASRWLTAGLFLGLTLVLASGAFLISLQTAERLYYSGWASMQVGGRKKKTTRVVQTVRAPTDRRFPLAGLVTRIIPQPVLSIMAKDFILIRRDLRNMSQVITPLIFGIIYAFMLFRNGSEPPAGRGEAPIWFMTALRSLMLYGNVAISLFVGWSLLSRLALMGFSAEGKQYWMLKSAPVSSNKLIFAKYLVAYLPSLALGWIFLLVITLVQRGSLDIFLYGSAVVAFSIAGTAGLELAFGIVGAKLDWEDPRRISQGGAGCVGALLSFVYLGITLLLFFGPPVVFLSLNWPGLIGQAIGLAAGGVVSLACATIPLWLVRDRVGRIGEGQI